MNNLKNTVMNNEKLTFAQLSAIANEFYHFLESNGIDLDKFWTCEINLTTQTVRVLGYMSPNILTLLTERCGQGKIDTAIGSTYIEFTEANFSVKLF